MIQLVQTGPLTPPVLEPELVEVNRIISNMEGRGLDAHIFYDATLNEVKDLYAYQNALRESHRIKNSIAL